MSSWPPSSALGPCQSQVLPLEVLLFWLPCHLASGLVTVACPECLFLLVAVFRAGQLCPAWLAGCPEPERGRRPSLSLSDLWASPAPSCGFLASSLWPCGSVPILAPLWPSPKHGCVPCMVDGYLRVRAESILSWDLRPE